MRDSDDDWRNPPLDHRKTLWGLSFLSIAYIKIAYIALILKILCKFFNGYRPKVIKICSGQASNKSSRLKTLLLRVLLAVFMINFLLIAIVNPSLLNPGPVTFSICYQNVRGLIPFSELSEAHPKLDNTKIYELNTYIAAKSPDIVLLSETWLKKSIADSEVISNSNYNVYRSDRSQVTHPSDPNNPTKFKKNGGGVLIATRSDIDANVLGMLNISSV